MVYASLTPIRRQDSASTAMAEIDGLRRGLASIEPSLMKIYWKRELLEEFSETLDKMRRNIQL